MDSSKKRHFLLPSIFARTNLPRLHAADCVAYMKLRLKRSTSSQKKLHVSKFEWCFYGQVYSGGPSSSKCEFFYLCLSFSLRVFHTLNYDFLTTFQWNKLVLVSSCSRQLLVLLILRACIIIES